MRQTILKKLHVGLTTIVITVQVAFFPFTALAQETPADVSPTDSEQSQPAEDTAATATDTNNQEQTTQQVGPTEPVGPQEPTGPTEPTGVQQPTGSDSTTYTYNSDTGLWENDYYTWDPVTRQTKPKTAPTYSYNPTTGMWDTTEYYYSPEQGKYVPNVVSVANNPNTGIQGFNNTISNTGPNSNNQIDNNNSSTSTFDLFFDASISNKIGQMSKSGDALVQGNTKAGSALTGDALALANILNMIQSSWGTLGSEDIALFIASLDGDVTGDLVVDPNALASGQGDKKLTVNSTSSAAIDNDIDVKVASGNATVNSNNTAGNAKSGNAQAVVNLFNLINSAIKSKKSFVGVLNINGNFNGDILLPPGMLEKIIAATGPNSNNQISGSNGTNVNVASSTKNTINNKIQTDASTGSATVSNNTNAGSATSGNANSNIVLLNLTGKKVVAKNALLVFVNVMGNWVGLIFDAPAGTNAVAVTGPNSNNTINGNNNLEVAVNSEESNLINNDINVTARSGDATVSENTNAGDATSGDANIGINVVNMIDSEFNVDDWFGVLFINVFGNWVGSFGVDTEAGNPPVGVVSGPASGAADGELARQHDQTFTFVPRTNASSDNTNQGLVAGATDKTMPPAISQTSSAAPAPSTSTVSRSGPRPVMTLWLAGIATIAGVLMIGGERVVVLLRSRYLA